MSIGLFIGSAGFLFGIPVSPWPMAFGFACAVAGAALVSWKRLLAFAAVASLCVGASLLTFSYTGTDAFVYHFPMQRLLVDGWNPVFDSTLEKFQVVLQEQGGGYVGVWHTLFLPRVSSLCGALLASLMRTFAADAFLGYVLIFALWRTAGRFARAQWLCGAFAANLFAAGLVFSSKSTSFLAGQVDYSTYATLLIALFSYLCWRKTPRGGDLLLSLLGIALCILSKSTGLICGLLFCLIVFACHWRRAEIRWGAVALCGFVLIVGFSPFVTNWVQYGSPFYPNMTFDPRVEIRDITADFTGNADALSMGFLSRVVYAWVSPGLAVKGCAWLSESPLAPTFRFEEETRLPLFEGLPQDSLTLAERFPICDTVQALIQFPWLEALIPPRPLFCPKGQSLQTDTKAKQSGKP